jgi:hypothetical protein
METFTMNDLAREQQHQHRLSMEEQQSGDSGNLPVPDDEQQTPSSHFQPQQHQPDSEGSETPCYRLVAASRQQERVYGTKGQNWKKMAEKATKKDEAFEKAGVDKAEATAEFQNQ